MTMHKIGAVGFGVLLVAALSQVQEVRAQSVNIGGQTCSQNYSLYDYYSNGVYQTSQWEPDGVSCYDNGSGGGDYEGFPGVGGGGGGSVDSDGVWVDMEGGTEVNVVKNQVRNKTISCYDDGPGGTEVRAAEVGRIVIRNPNLKASTTVTAIWSDAKQTFRRANPGASTAHQMVATSGCF